ncbi:hypothetical protein AB6A40_006647 [Gnathostoma spinigerum]|uniref:Uncharacterized protein n=1 Tax=Gnathostoma spinigerum TaxID=75299 RepID=A0ABD6EJ67_9BILA
MGNILSSSSSDSLFSGQLQKAYDKQIETLIALHSLQFEQKNAYELAKRRDSLSWEFLGAGTLIATIIAIAPIYKSKLLAVPLVPLVFGVGYRYDQCYGSHEQEVKDNANILFNSKPKQFSIIGGPITLQQLDDRIKKSFVEKSD